MALNVLFENKNTFFVSLLYLSFIKPTNVSDHFTWPCISIASYSVLSNSSNSNNSVSHKYAV